MLLIYRKAQGFSIVELLVAMGISLLLLAGVATMFVSSKGAYETNDRLARLEENGRFALDTITRGVRAAGYSGCTSSANPYVAVNNTNNFISAQDPTSTAVQDPNNNKVIILNPSIEGFNYTSAGNWTPALYGFMPAPSNGSDVLLLRAPAAGTAPIELSVNMASDTDNITVPAVASGNGYFSNHQLLMIGDCNNRSYFEVTGYSPTTGVVQHAALSAGAGYNGNWTNSVGFLYKKRPSATDTTQDFIGGGAQVYTSQMTVYYVAPASADPTYNSLWRQVDSNPVEELIEGVDSMQLLYGLDTITEGQGAIDTYSATATDPKQIVSITISLLIRSVDQYGALTDTKIYDLLGPADPTAKYTAPGDRRQRQLFTTTVWVRNPST